MSETSYSSLSEALERLKFRPLKGQHNTYVVSLNDSQSVLFSYETVVARYDNFKFYFKGHFSVTTTKHIKQYFQKCTGYTLEDFLPKLKGCKSLADIQRNIYCIEGLGWGVYKVTTNEDEVYCVTLSE